jgi:hypothetical protein
VLARSVPVDCVDRFEHEVAARAQALRLARWGLRAGSRAALLLLLLLLGRRDALVLLLLLCAGFSRLLLLWPTHALLKALKLQRADGNSGKLLLLYGFEATRQSHTKANCCSESSGSAQDSFIDEQQPTGVHNLS